jgi:hypothetical protein
MGVRKSLAAAPTQAQARGPQQPTVSAEKASSPVLGSSRKTALGAARMPAAIDSRLRSPPLQMGGR